MEGLHFKSCLTELVHCKGNMYLLEPSVDGYEEVELRFFSVTREKKPMEMLIKQKENYTKTSNL